MSKTSADQTPVSRLVGIVLAAGYGKRYDPSGERLKLLQPMMSGRHTDLPIVIAAVRNLQMGVQHVIAVIRARDCTHQPQLHDALSKEGCELVVCENAIEGIGASLACGIRAAANADGWIVALGDMPSIEAATVEAVASALRAGHTTVAPTYRGQRGHPVGFSARCLSELLSCAGDEGARKVLQKFPPHLIAANDAGILEDVDQQPAS